MIGSKWRKWDLHLHTPTSYDYADKSVTDEDIVNTLIADNVEVVAITDHHIIDIDRIKRLQNLGKGKLIILPGIEFLSDAKGDDPVHFIAIFDEKSDINYIWGQLKNLTDIKRIYGEGKKHNEVYCHLLDTIKLIKKLNGIVTIHAGSKSNSFECITHSLPHGLAQKEDIAKAVDVFELGQEKDLIPYNKMVIPYLIKSIGKKIPMIICSDNHNIKKYTVKQALWIKGEPTFEALKQIIFEPDYRVYIGENPPIDPLLRIDKVSFNFPENSSFENEAFCFSGSNEIKFSPNFTCIIGGRGTGKSTLLNLIHEKLKPEQNGFFKFRKVKDATGKILPIGNFTTIDNDEDEKYIEFLSQNEVEEFAQSYEKLTSAIYARLLKQDEKGAILQKERELTEELKAYKRHTIDLTRIQSLKKDLIQKQKEIATYQKIVDSFTSADYVRISGELLVLTARLSEIKKSKTAFDKLKKDLTEITSFNTVSDSTNAYDLELNKIIKAINGSLTNVDVQKIGEAEKEFELLELSKNEKQEELKNYLSEKGVNHESQNDIANANTIISQLSVDVTQKEEEINALDAKLNKFDKSKLVKASHEYKNELESHIKNVSSTLENIDNSSVKPISLSLELNVDAAKEKAFENFKALFEGKISQSNHKGDGVLRDILFCIHPEKIIDKTSLLEAIKKCQSTSTAKSFLLQLFQDDANFEAYKCLCERNLLDYFEFKKIKVQYDKRPIETSSFGQRCTAVLVILLLLGNNPIIIDEPEAHLDSYLIANYLVDVIKKTKQNRQIIFATHNANFVINGDAELIHVLSINATTGISQIESTTIENSETKEVLVSLEGGKDAFHKRENKYQF